MGLRINTNVSAMGALRNLHRADNLQQASLERLSTGLRINRASDDPSGFVISEQLRAQIRGMEQAAENSQNASNLMGTAEAALSEVNSLLMSIRESVVFAMNSGGNDPAQIDAEQDAIDNALRSIDRISQTTRFGTRNLLDGTSGISASAVTAGQFDDINVQSVAFSDMGATSQTYTVNVTTAAAQADVSAATGGNFGTFTSANADTVIRVTGALGTRDITLANGALTADFATAVNSQTAETGVFVDGTNSILSTEFGASQNVTLELISGNITTSVNTFAAGGATTNWTAAGTDVAGNVNGMNFRGSGNDLRIVSDVLSADLRLASGAAVGAYDFTVNNDGLVFQLNQSYAMSDREQIGLKDIGIGKLGSQTRTSGTQSIGGFLSSLMSGEANDLGTDPLNALRIVDEAIAEVSDHRAYLGAFQSQTVDTNLSSLRVAIENLTASESAIRDLDFAAESAAFTRNQILYQSGIAVLAQSNLISQSVLTLLG